MVDLSVKLGGLILSNPIIPASGCFGYGYEFASYYDINKLGSFSCKGTTLEPRFGNPTPRIAEANDGMLNSIGLQNPGVDVVINEELKKLSKVFNKKIVANVGGFTVDEYKIVAQKLSASDSVGIIELNVSCPNVHEGGVNFGSNANSAAKVVSEVKKVCDKPVYAKLSPNVTDIASIAKACEDAGADGITLINTLLGMRIDLKTKKPILANKFGGYSGSAVLPIALRCVYQVYEAVRVPIIGVGGISCAEDVLEMMLAGATAVEVGAANLINPYICSDIIDALPSVMEKYNISKLSDIIGDSHR